MRLRGLNRAGESGDSGFCLAGLGDGGILTVVGSSLEFGGRDVAAGLVQAPVVVPADVLEGAVLRWPIGAHDRAR
jgi:hypothetical protein